MSTLLAVRCFSKSTSAWLQSSGHKLGSHFKHSQNILPAAQRLATITNLGIKNENITNNYEWRTIYRLPLIKLASAFNRLKVSCAVLNTLLIPGSFALEQSNYLPPATSVVISTIAISSFATLCICSLATYNLIGIIYINNAGDKLKLAYVDYWGDRRELCVKLDDIIPESEKLKPSRLDFYQWICLYSDNKIKYKLLPKYGYIEDPYVFVSIFGE